MAAKKKSGKRKQSSGGSLMSMRSGIQRAAGTKKKGKGKGKKKEASFGTVLLGVLGVAVVMIIIWQLAR